MQHSAHAAYHQSCLNWQVFSHENIMVVCRVVIINNKNGGGMEFLEKIFWYLTWVVIRKHVTMKSKKLWICVYTVSYMTILEKRTWKKFNSKNKNKNEEYFHVNGMVGVIIDPLLGSFNGKFSCQRNICIIFFYLFSRSVYIKYLYVLQYPLLLYIHTYKYRHTHPHNKYL